MIREKMWMWTRIQSVALSFHKILIQLYKLPPPLIISRYIQSCTYTPYSVDELEWNSTPAMKSNLKPRVRSQAVQSHSSSEECKHGVMMVKCKNRSKYWCCLLSKPKDITYWNACWGLESFYSWNLQAKWVSFNQRCYICCIKNKRTIHIFATRWFHILPVSFAWAHLRSRIQSTGKPWVRKLKSYI